MYNRYHYSYWRNNDHAVRDAFLGLMRSILTPLHELWLILLVLKLCGVIQMPIGWIIGIFTARILLDFILDLVNIAVDKKDKEEEEKRRMRYVSAYREETDPGCESGDRGETDPYPGYGEAD